VLGFLGVDPQAARVAINARIKRQLIMIVLFFIVVAPF